VAESLPSLALYFCPFFNKVKQASLFSFSRFIIFFKIQGDRMVREILKNRNTLKKITKGDFLFLKKKKKKKKLLFTQ